MNLVHLPVESSRKVMRSPLNSKDQKKHKLTVCIAGKNNIAVNALRYLIENYKDEVTLRFLPNNDDMGVDQWQRSFKKFSLDNGVRQVALDELYAIQSLLFISLEYSLIIDTRKFLTDRLFNIHFSLLPKYKGVYTSALPIIKGDEESGVTLHRIDNGIDTGEIVDQMSFKIGIDDTARDLYMKYMHYGYLVFIKNIKKLIEQTFVSTPQSAIGASYYSRKAINYKEISIDFFKTAFEIRNQFRGYTFREYQLPTFERWSISNAKILEQRSTRKPGTVVSEDDAVLVVSTVDYDIMLFKDYYDALWSSCETGDLVGVNNSLKFIPDINVKNRAGQNAIIIAGNHGHRHVVKRLTEAGAHVAAT